MYYQQRSFLKKSRYLFTCLVLCLFANFLNAQSGRRVKTQPDPPAPEISNPEPKPEKTAEETVKPLYKLKIFGNTRSVGISKFIFHARMSGWVADRLRNSLLLEVFPGTDATLSEAKKIAKNSPDLFIVLVELDEDRFALPSRSGTSSVNGDFAIKYYVLEPGTGKTKFSGQVNIYSEIATNNRQVLGSNRLCYPQLSGNDLMLLESSIETADRIISRLKIPIPPYKCSPKL